MGTGTSTGQWIGYQIIGGAARGIGLQVVSRPTFVLVVKCRAFAKDTPANNRRPE